MKNKILYFLVFSLGLISCGESYLEVEPETEITYSNFWQTAEDFESAVLGINNMMRQSILNPFVTDDLEKAAAMVDYSDVYGDFYGFTDAKDLHYGERTREWTAHYQTIFLCNSFLHTPYRNTDGIEKELMNFFDGQVYFTLGYCYFDLARRWGDAPIVLDVDIENGRRARQPAINVIDTAIVLAEKAYEMLKPMDQLSWSDGSSVVSKQIPHKAACAALLAELYAWKAYVSNHNSDLYKKAEQYCTELINGNNSLAANHEEVCNNVFSMNPHSEVIYEANMRRSDQPNNQYRGLLSSAIGYPVVMGTLPGMFSWGPFYLPRFKLSNMDQLFGVDDQRRYSYFYELDENMKPENFYLNGGYAYPYKVRNVRLREGWNGQMQHEGLDTHKIIWRLAGIYLLRAECRNKIGDAAGALADLNIIRNRAGLDNYNNEDGSDLQYAIFKEMDRELFLEPGRYFYCVRNGYLNEISDRYGELTDQEVVNGALYLPVGKSAFPDNDLMRQTPYWLDKFNY